jgi:hypothetical protein
MSVIKVIHSSSANPITPITKKKIIKNKNYKKKKIVNKKNKIM